MPTSPLALIGIATRGSRSGRSGSSRPRNLAFVGRVLFPLGAAVGAGARARRLRCDRRCGQQSTVLPLGLPDLPFHLRLDALSAFFLLLLGAPAPAISLFAAGYFRSGEGTAPGAAVPPVPRVPRSMALVLLADDAYAFMVAWETMALSSFFLVTTDHRIPEIRRAGYLYLLIAHVGAIAILLCFGVLQGGTGDYTFATCARQHCRAAGRRVAFLLALFGFGAKAGILPLHVWLPEAHPAAPSPVSALMSGVMLKTAIYGLLRVTFDLLGTPALVVGRGRARARPRHRAVRRRVRRRADRHEAPARLLVDREHRPDGRRASASRSCSPPTAWRRSRRSR